MGDDLAGARVDALCARLLGVSVREARRHVEQGTARLDGAAVKKGDRPRAGQRLEVTALAPWLAPAAASWWRLVYEDDDIVVADKPTGVPCHPLERGEGGTLLDAAVWHAPAIASAGPDPREGGLVHRIDNLTSGLVCFARTPAAHERLRAQLAAGEVARSYLAIVSGDLGEPLSLTGPIAHDPSDDRLMVVAHAGVAIRGEPRTARSVVTPIACAQAGGATLVRVALFGGRRHQIRVHLAAAGHALLGDRLYGGPPLEERAGQALHASRMELPGRPALEAPLPADLRAALKRLAIAFVDP